MTKRERKYRLKYIAEFHFDKKAQKKLDDEIKQLDDQSHAYYEKYQIAKAMYDFNTMAWTITTPLSTKLSIRCSMLSDLLRCPSGVSASFSVPLEKASEAFGNWGVYLRKTL